MAVRGAIGLSILQALVDAGGSVEQKDLAQVAGVSLSTKNTYLKRLRQQKAVSTLEIVEITKHGRDLLTGMVPNVRSDASQETVAEMQSAINRRNTSIPRLVSGTLPASVFDLYNFVRQPTVTTKEATMTTQSTLPGVADENADLLDHVAKDGGVNYRPGFFHWLRDNWHIWKRFVQEADKVRAMGRKHYSARTIGEFLRHETALSELDTFKINNNAFPSCARLYMHLRSCPGFFELRGN